MFLGGTSSAQDCCVEGPIACAGVRFPKLGGVGEGDDSGAGFAWVGADFGF